MNQVFEHYEKWECYQNGMYNLRDIPEKDQRVEGSRLLLSSPLEFYQVCKKVVSDWPISTAVNLTNKQLNRRAWLGAAASMIKHQCPEHLTRVAWGLLTESEQIAANKVAEKIILEYTKNTSYAKTLFE
jgi:hypothetical protein